MPDLWAASRAGDVDARDALILQYTHLVVRTASQVRSTLPRHVEVVDLQSWGTFGLIEAVDRYEPSRGAFEQFAGARIRGAILDGLRSLDWTPRSVRAVARSAAAARARLEMSLSREPTLAEVAAELHVPPAHLAQILDQARIHRVASLSLDADDATHDEGYVTYADTLVDVTADPEYRPETVDWIRQAVAEGLEKLSERHRLVVALRYVATVDVVDGESRRGYSFTEIAELLGVSNALVTQLHTAALLDLQRSFRAALAAVAG